MNMFQIPVLKRVLRVISDKLGSIRLISSKARIPIFQGNPGIAVRASIFVRFGLLVLVTKVLAKGACLVFKRGITFACPGRQMSGMSHRED